MTLKISKGDRFGKLTVLHEAEKTCRRRRFIVVCDCGNERNVILSNLRSGQARSCGCARSNDPSSLAFKHGETGTRKYICWVNMKVRAERRDFCEIYPEWLEYIKFSEWADNNGYKENLVLCRNGDKGNYEPGNVRWDTVGNNTIEALAKDWIVINPDGTSERVYNLAKFCRDSGLCVSEMHKTADGRVSSHKGFSCKRDEW